MTTNKARVLYITFDGICDSLGRSQVLPYLIGLRKKGHAIHVLSAEKPAVFQAHSTVVQQLVDKHGIKWTFIPYFNKPPLLGPFLLKQKMTKLAAQLMESEPFTIIHCRSYLAAMIGAKLKQKNDVKYIFDMRGFWADERVDGKIWNRKNPIYNQLYRYFKKQEKKLLQEADYIITLTHTSKEILHSWTHLGGEKWPIQVVPCCVDLERFDRKKIDEDKRKNYADKLDIQNDDFILSYLGSIGTWYMLEEMLDFFNVVLEEKPNAKFLFISKEKELIQSTCVAKNIPLERVIVQSVPYDDVPILLSFSHVSIFFILPVFSKKASSPIKQGEIMAMEIPIVCNSGVGDTDYVINTYNAGVLIHKFSDHAYKTAWQDCVQHRFDGESIRNGAVAIYNLENGVSLYHEVYKKVSE